MFILTIAIHCTEGGCRSENFLVPCCPVHLFLRASSMLKHVLAIGWTSVRPSVTRWYCIKTALK